MTTTPDYWRVGLLALVTTVLTAGCGGSSGDGSASVAVSGTVATDGGGAVTTDSNARDTFRIRATAASGSVHEADSDPATARFTIMLTPNQSYVLGFEHRDMMSSAMHFAGYMVFDCDAGESDHFFVSGRERAIDLGTIMVRRDGSFARPGRNPLDQLDGDGDGLPDSQDPDAQCVDVGNHDGDGFYDDDMNHDGYHDDDMDRDGHRDCEMGGMGHDDEVDNCPGPDTTPGQTTSAIPEGTRTPQMQMTPMM